MLRIATRQSVAKIFRLSIRHESGSSVSAPRSSGIGKKLLGFTLFTGSAAVIGITGYAYKDPDFRRCVEKHVPQTKTIFSTMFGPIEEKQTVEKTPKTTDRATTSDAGVPEFVPYLLIGAGTASYYAALTIRARDPDAIVLILGDENENAYARTHLSKELWWYGDKKFAETLQYTSLSGRTRDVFFEVDGFYIPPSNWSKFPHGCISILKNARVKQINVANKTALLESGQKIRFNKCLIATGSRPKINKELERSDLAGRIHTLYTIKDFRKINDLVGKSREIAIIGNGFLASELAYSLKRRFHHINDVKIYQVFKEDDVLEEVLPVKLCEDASKQIFKEGVKLVNKSELFDVSRTKEGKLRLMLLKEDGNKYEIFVDHIIDVSGSQPNSEIARRAGLEIDKDNGGVVVDSGMRARQDIFAAGDVSSFFDLNLGRRRIEHAENAEITGRVAGENMTGGNRIYPRQASFHSTVGANAHITGVGRVDTTLKTVVVTAQKSPEFDDELRAVAFYEDKGRIVGVTLYNVFGDGLWVARKLIEDQVPAKNVDDLARLFRLYPLLKTEEAQESNADSKDA